MSILFVLLTFLLIMSITYFLRREQPAAAVQPRVYAPAAAPTACSSSMYSGISDRLFGEIWR